VVANRRPIRNNEPVADGRRIGDVVVLATCQRLAKPVYGDKDRLRFAQGFFADFFGAAFFGCAFLAFAGNNQART
jgi:hypothetical protein